MGQDRGSTMVQRLAEFVCRAEWRDVSPEARQALKIRVLDSLGCAMGALNGEPIAALRGYLDELGGNAGVSLIGGGRATPERAALFNGALIRYLDYNDSFLAPGETCHPSDNVGAVLAVSEYGDLSGAEFLTALAVAYQVQCRLSEGAPVRAEGFDHVTQGVYAAAAGVARALGLDLFRTANAIAISGTAFNALRVTRTGALSHWKGLAAPNAAFAATHATFLARHGITGPPEVFEGNKGFMETIAGSFDIDWNEEDLEAVRRTILKRYNAEIHSQSTLEGVLELKAEHGITGDLVERVELDVFEVAYHIIGGGEEGTKYEVSSKEAADHSLPYMVAVALLDGWVGPEQYGPERIVAEDVQQLLRRVVIRPDYHLSQRFPNEMPVRIRLQLSDGRTLEKEKSDYQGFATRPMSWEAALEKFDRLASRASGPDLRREIAGIVRQLDQRPVSDLAVLLRQVETPRPVNA